MEWIINQLRDHPELAIFLTLFAGFWLGRFKIGKFSLGTVTSVLLVGVLVGQLNISVDGPMKAVFFLLFLFAVGYKVGPQFFRGFEERRIAASRICRPDVHCQPHRPMDTCQNHGLPCRRGCRIAGRLTDHFRSNRCGKRHDQSIKHQRCAESDIYQCHPRSIRCDLYFRYGRFRMDSGFTRSQMLGGLEKVKADCKELEAKMGTSEADEPDLHALRPVVFRAYK